jgi:hypothetical protein
MVCAFALPLLAVGSEKRSTSNKIRVQRLINNITQNPHPLYRGHWFWLFPVLRLHSARSLPPSSLQRCLLFSIEQALFQLRRPILFIKNGLANT